MDNIKNTQNKKMEPESGVGKYKWRDPDLIIKARNSNRKQKRLAIGSGLIGLFLIIGGILSIGTGIGIYLLILGSVMLVFAAALVIVLFWFRTFMPHDYSGLYFNKKRN